MNADLAINPSLVNLLMDTALEQAKRAGSLGEVPVGAAFYHHNNIISSAHNLVETNHDASAHAEILALRQAAKVIGDWRLNEGILCVTLEPCTMCCGAIRLARVGTLIFGASDPNLGAVGSLYNLCEDPRLGQLPRVIHGVKQDQCSTILSEFFSRIRETPNSA